jgi:hypothetical protein
VVCKKSRWHRFFDDALTAITLFIIIMGIISLPGLCRVAFGW